MKGTAKLATGATKCPPRLPLDAALYGEWVRARQAGSAGIGRGR